MRFSSAALFRRALLSVTALTAVAAAPAFAQSAPGDTRARGAAS